MSTKKTAKTRRKKTATPAQRPSVAEHVSDSPVLRIIRHRALAVVFLFVVSFSVFVPTLHNGLVWDDLKFVESWGPKLKDMPMGLNLLFPSRNEEARSSKYYRPVFSASLIMDAKIWGNSYFGYHLTSILLHSVSTVLLYLLILLLFKEFNRGPGESEAFLGSMFFAVYPIHIESVSFISARGDILALMFFLLCLIFYILSYRNNFFILLAGASFYLSFLSKEVAFSFPFIILGFDLLSRRLFSRASIIKYIVIGVLVIVYYYLRWGSIENSLNILNTAAYRETGSSPGVLEFITQFLGAYLFYVWKLIYPYDLNHFIGALPAGDALKMIISVLLIIGVISVFIVSFKKKENITAFSLLWIFAALGPAVLIAIYPLAVTRYAERFLYVPSAAFCMLLGYLIVRGGRLTGWRWAAAAVGGLLCVSYIVVTVKDQKIWKDEITFWEAVIKKSPDQLVPRVNYGEALRKYGRADEAIRQHAALLDLGIKGSQRGKSFAAISLALDYIDKGDYRKAEEYLDIALRYDPGIEAKYNYYRGYIYMKQDDIDSARPYLEKAIELQPVYPQTLYLLGVASVSDAKKSRSYDVYRHSASLLERAVEQDRGFIAARLLLAQVYIAIGEREKA
ncbi:MAG TPA: tetratricopeptide repeat protein, partial [Thermodesulfobacteriota bacterium]|nr:tetratricopeptide repeat protein [Thermodesulfobacteriota bacterium]